jgi:hypothetical protein
MKGRDFGSVLHSGMSSVWETSSMAFKALGSITSCTFARRISISISIALTRLA